MSQSHDGLGKVLGPHRPKEMGDAVSWEKNRQMFQLNRVHLEPVYCSAIRVVTCFFHFYPWKHSLYGNSLPATFVPAMFLPSRNALQPLPRFSGFPCYLPSTLALNAEVILRNGQFSRFWLGKVNCASLCMQRGLKCALLHHFVRLDIF